MSESAVPPFLGYQNGLYDSAFMGILQHCVKLPPFLDAFFSFLARRTDFYILLRDDNPKMGFPPGVAEEMVRSAFKKYEVLTRKREAEMMREKETKRLEFLEEKKPPVVKEKVEEPEVDIQDELPITLPPSAEEEEESEATGESSEKSKEKRKDAPVLSKEKVDDWEKVSDVYNGGDMEKYKWSQSMTDLDVRIPVPEGSTGKNIRVEIRSNHLKVLALTPSRQLLIDKSLLHKIKVEESVWTIDSARKLLTVTLEKTKEVMWKSVFKGEKEIDLTKVDTTRDISEFDPECQAAIQRATYDQHLKRLGKPTSQEKKAHEMLRKAWNAEGSPFKGTPFDPSKVQISGGNW